MRCSVIGEAHIESPPEALPVGEYRPFCRSRLDCATSNQRIQRRIEK
jgi:hypothetical protein